MSLPRSVQLRCGDRLLTGVQALIFDKDGTLANSEAYLTQLVLARQAAIAAHVPTLDDRLLRSWGYLDGQLDPAGLMAIGSRQENLIAAAAAIAAEGYPWPRSIAIATSAFAESDAVCNHKAQQTPPLEGVLELLDQAKQLGLKIAIISADRDREIQAFLDCYQLTDQVELFWGSDRQPSKPDPAALRIVCQQLGVEPQAAVMIGDADTDLRMAAGANVPAIAAAWGWSQPPQFEEAAPVAAILSDVQFWADC